MPRPHHHPLLLRLCRHPQAGEVAATFAKTAALAAAQKRSEQTLETR
eukprot:COSAG05_NODE_20693_length_277_cov_1.151685_1_plen_46_part_01